MPCWSCCGNHPKSQLLNITWRCVRHTPAIGRSRFQTSANQRWHFIVCACVCMFYNFVWSARLSCDVLDSQPAFICLFEMLYVRKSFDLFVEHNLNHETSNSLRPCTLNVTYCITYLFCFYYDSNENFKSNETKQISSLSRATKLINVQAELLQMNNN